MSNRGSGGTVDTLASKVSAFGREGSTPSFRMEELRIDVFTHAVVNADPNVRITHMPTGTVVVGTGKSRGTKSMYKLKQILLAELSGKLGTASIQSDAVGF